MYGAYERSAEVYDVLYEQLVDYDVNAERVAGLIYERQPQAATLLEVASGTGAYLERLSRRFEVVGLDRSPQMLRRARQKYPDIELVEGDMTGFDLGRRFDAVVCLFSSIAYVQTLAALRSTMKCFADHLNPGGVVVLEPWFPADQWDDGYVGIMSARTEELAVARSSTSIRESERSVILRFGFAVAYPDGTIDTFVEDHPTGQFTVDEHLVAFTAAGLAADYDPEGLMGRGLYVARKDGSPVP
ncbi:MAG: class I SAM-dependent methyltransferase [Acidimicrobiia bacterium]|nr:MAG: class I SAM-dependent methyltransferase [Acidimicrobiia bacterium]